MIINRELARDYYYYYTDSDSYVVRDILVPPAME